jgi:hypothetical protein
VGEVKLEELVEKIVAHPDAAFFNLYTYKQAPGKFHCSVFWDDTKLKSLMASGDTPVEAATKVLEMLNGERPRRFER